MFIEALLTKAKTRKESNCPWTEEWLKKMYTYRDTHVYTHVHTHIHTRTQNGILLSHKKELSHAICSNKDGPKDLH